MSDWRRRCVVLGITALALVVIANCGHPKGLSQAPEESRIALQAKTPEAPITPTRTAEPEAWPVRWVLLPTNFITPDAEDGTTYAETLWLDKVSPWYELGLNGVVINDKIFCMIKGISCVDITRLIADNESNISSIGMDTIENIEFSIVNTTDW